MRYDAGEPPRGFSLIELMVGMAIALIGMLLMAEALIFFQEKQRTALAGADAFANGVLASFLMERDLRTAGYGISQATGCSLRRSLSSGTALPLLNIQPVNIGAGIVGSGTGASAIVGTPDTIRLLRSTKAGAGAPYLLSAVHPVGAASLAVNATLGIDIGDLLLLYQPSTDCVMVEANTVTPTPPAVAHAAGTGKWNPPTPATAFPVAFNIGAAVLNTGLFGDVRYQIDSGSLVRSVYQSGTNTVVSERVAADIVFFKAQYGFDMRSGVQTEVQVDRWSSMMLDADGSSTVGDAGDLLRIGAVRYALVARSADREKTAPNASCTRTTALPVWRAGTLNTNNTYAGLGSVAIPVDADPAWKCYRYRVFEAVVPLRNALWRSP